MHLAWWHWKSVDTTAYGARPQDTQKSGKAGAPRWVQQHTPALVVQIFILD